MNMNRKAVEAKLGQPKAEIGNKYGTKWFVYHQDFNDFVMVSYINQKVHGLYTNQNMMTSKSGVKYGTAKDVVRAELGTPIKGFHKGRTIYEIDNEEYDVFDDDGIYTTVFYDKHENNQLTGMLQVSHLMENQLTHQYAAPSNYLRESFEKQDFYLLNAERVQKGLHPLAFSESLAKTARKHSTDMAKHHYFDHTNQQGESPFDRMKKDGHQYQTAAENLAYGQTDAIFAHHGLMNSLGHRKNILNTDVTQIGIGVDFNAQRQPYWTENYIG
ncbi:secretion protein [Staphylococcus lutrae]|uniref:Secretion protein n=2 Tax=Staphylococcus lutrae TaxID=155085 RepID=A0AAC9RQN0_9STAP|nr:secretion protein [Staphylococcus lutrae]PNZ35590.1 secretion protein [Staphylococcus lutrae]